MSRLLLLGPDAGIPRRGLVARWRPGSHNLLQQSGNLAVSPWFSDNGLAAVTTANAAIGPSGSMTATKFHQDTVASAKDLYQFFNITNGTTYHISFALKAAEFPGVQITDQGSLSASVNFDASSGTQNSGGGPGYISSSVSPEGNGWYRCDLTYVNQQTTGSHLIVFYLLGTPTTLATGVDGVSGVYLDEVQINAGNERLPYVKTTDLQTIPDLSGNGNTLQRGSTSGVDANDWTVETWDGLFNGTSSYGLGSHVPLLGGAQWTAAAVMTNNSAPNAAQVLYSERNNSTSFPISEITIYNNNIRATVRDNAQVLVDALPPANPIYGSWAFVAGRRTDNLVEAIRGTTVLKQATGALGAITLTNGGMGAALPSGAATAFFNGKIADVCLYNVALTPAEIQRLYTALKRYYAGNGSGISI